MHKVKRLLVFAFTLLLLLNMTQIPHVFAMDGKSGMAASEQPLTQDEPTPDPTEDTTPDVTEDTTPEDTTPVDTTPEETGHTGPGEPETSFVTICGTTVDELNEPLAGCEFHLVAVDGSELSDEEWAKLDLTFEKSEFCFDIPANVEYRVLVTHESKQYAEYKTVLVASENTDLGNVVIPFAKLKLTFTLVNAKAKCLISDAQGGNVSNVDTDEANPITVSYGSSVFISFYPASGCQLPEQVEVNGTKVDLVDNSYKIMSCTADTGFALTANDVTAPAITNIEIADEDTWTQSKIVTITATDNINSTSELQIYTSKTLYTTTADVTAKATLLPDHKDVVTENAVYYVYAIDAAGNMKREQYEVTKIDRTAPVISDFQADTSTWTLTVVYTAHIEDNAQLSRVYWVSHLGIEHDLNLTADGNYEFTVYYNGTISLIAEDVAGNRTTVSTTVENIDNDPPVISDIVVQERWDAEKNLVMFSVTDNVGIDSVEIIDPAGEKTKITLEEGSSTYRYYATSNGTYTIKATDTVGNQTTAQFEVNRIDTEAPVIASISRTPDQDWTNESITVSVGATDSQSGVDKVYIIASSEHTETTTLDQWQVMTLNDAGQYVFIIENNKNIDETYLILCADKVGRLSEISMLDIRIDITAPEITDITPDAETWVQQITYTFHVSDNGELNNVSWIKPDNTETGVELTENGIGTMTVAENGEHKIRATDKAGNVTEVTVSVELIDLEAPVIVSIAPQTTWDANKNTASITITDNRAIQTVYVVDVAGTEMSLEATSGIYVFTATENGSYTVHAIDVAGNESTAPFEINHIDKEAPVVTSVVKSPASEWTNQNITVTATAADSQSGIDNVYIIAGSMLTDETPLTQWQVMTLNEAGQYVVVLDNTQDRFDTYYIRCADKVGRLSDMETLDIKLDVTPPEVSGITLDTDTWAQEITYSFNVTDNGLLDSVTWITPYNTETVLTCGEDGTYTKTVNANGEHKIVATDKAGNMTEVIIPVNLIDREAPTIVSIAPQMTWDAEENTATITVEDNCEIQRVYVVSADGEETTLNGTNGVYVFSTLTNGVYTAFVRDVAGNESSAQFTIDHIDTESPEITSVTIDPEVEWCAEPVKVTVRATDSQSGIKTIRVITQSELVSDNPPEMKDWTALQAEEDGSFTFIVPNDVDSIETYHFVAEDHVGRFSALESRTIKIDVTAPTIFDVAANTDIWNREIIYTFKVTDNDAMQSVKYTTPSGQTTVFDLSETSEYEFTAIENGDYLVEAFDMAGNRATKTITVSKVDRVNPVIERIVPQTAWDATKNTAEIIASDNAQMQRVYVTDAAGNEFTLVEAQSNHYTFTTLLNGTYTVTAVDVAGNTASAQFTIDHIDTEIPTITSITKDPDAQWTTHSVKVTVIPADSQSGVKAVYAAAESIVDPSEDVSKWTLMQKTGAGYVYVIPNDKDSLDTYHFIVEDNVGRFSEIETFVIGIDVTAPETVKVTYARGELTGFFTELSFFSPFAVLYRDYVTVNATANDLFCGVNRYEYQIVREGESLSDSKWKAMPLTNEGETGNATVVIRENDFIGSIYVRVYDNLGNCTQAITDTENGETVICVLENTPDEYDQRSAAPALTTRTEKPDGTYEPGVWTKADVVVHGESEGPVSGVKLYQYQIVPVGQMLEESKWINLEPMKKDVKKAEIRITEDANVDVYMRTVSNAENASKYSRVRVRVQKSLPQNAAVQVTGTMGTNNWYVGLPTITITPPQVDSMASPVTTIYSLIKHGDAAYTVIYGENKPVIKEDGVYFLSVWTVDEAGNKCAKTYNETILVDTTAPTDLTLKIGDKSILAKTQGHSVFDLIYSDAVFAYASANCDISGIAELSYQKVYNNAAYSANGVWTTWPRDGHLRINPNENCVIYLRAIDKAGNTTIVHSDGIIIDDTAPQGDGQENISLRVVGANANGYFAGDATVDVTIADPVVNQAMSGLKTIYYQVITDGVVTQEETIGVSANGTNIAKVSSETGNNGYVYKWNGRITIRAAANNSDNIIVKVTAVDQAGNRRMTSTAPGAIKIDTTAPTVIMSYNNNRADTTYRTAYFDSDRVLTIRVTERDFDARLANLVITRNGVVEPVALTWTKTAGSKINGDDNVYTASITIHEDGEYKVSLTLKDFAGNEAASIRFIEGTLAGAAFVMDQTAPTIQVSYDNNDVKNDHYFDAARTMTITVKDDSFTPDRFTYQIEASKEEKSFQAPKVGDWTHNGDQHTAKIVFKEDGDYTFTCAVTDMAGNKSANASYGTSAAPTAFTIDTVPVEVKVEGLEKNTAYSGALAPTITFQDVNFDNYTVKLTVTNMDISGQDVTEKFIQKHSQLLDTDFSGTDIDGIYLLTFSFTDKAGHVTEDSYKFTINRNGSVYEYSEDLLGLINGYVQTVNGVYTITEYNPSPVEKSTVLITLDGEPLDDVKWKTETVNENGENWYKYLHTIEAGNYTKDGRYRTTLTTEDGAENKTENTNSGGPEIIFWLDTTTPEISSITGMENSIINASKQDVRITVYDTIGLSDIKVYVSENGGEEKLIVEKSEFAEGEESSCVIDMTLQEGLRQHVRIVVTDKAGNTTDSDKDQLNSAIQFVDDITVSKNFFVRWYADPWVFFGSIGGGLTLIAGAIGLILILKKKKKERKDARPTTTN